MLMLLSPSKTLDLTPLTKPLRTTDPVLIKETLKLAPLLKKMSRAQLARLMDISPKLAELNHQRFQVFSYPYPAGEEKPALFMFKGDVYEPMHVTCYTKEQLAFASKHLRILSGFYGLLRPLDNMFPYRLEMGTKLKNPRGATLYDFWGDLITAEINKAAKAAKSECVLNLASEEYFSAVKKEKLTAPLVSIQFKDWRGGDYKTIALFAKKARGMMADAIIQNGITTIDEVKKIRFAGYTCDKSASTESTLLFTRREKVAA